MLQNAIWLQKSISIQPRTSLGKCDVWDPRSNEPLVVFNLGYLPGADKSICTTGPTTVAALEAALPALAVGG